MTASSVSRNVAHIIREFGDALCSHVFAETETRCLRLTAQCALLDENHPNKHDDALPQEAALQRMRAFGKEGDD